MKHEKKILIERAFILAIAEYLKNDKEKKSVCGDLFEVDNVKGFYKISQLSLNGFDLDKLLKCYNEVKEL